MTSGIQNFSLDSFQKLTTAELDQTLFQQRNSSGELARSFKMKIGGSTYNISIGADHKVTASRTFLSNLCHGIFFGDKSAAIRDKLNEEGSKLRQRLTNHDVAKTVLSDLRNSFRPQMANQLAATSGVLVVASSGVQNEIQTQQQLRTTRGHQEPVIKTLDNLLPANLRGTYRNELKLSQLFKTSNQLRQQVDNYVKKYGLQDQVPSRIVDKFDLFKAMSRRVKAGDKGSARHVSDAVEKFVLKNTSPDLKSKIQRGFELPNMIKVAAYVLEAEYLRQRDGKGPNPWDPQNWPFIVSDYKDDPELRASYKQGVLTILNDVVRNHTERELTKLAVHQARAQGMPVQIGVTATEAGQSKINGVHTSDAQGSRPVAVSVMNYIDRAANKNEDLDAEKQPAFTPEAGMKWVSSEEALRNSQVWSDDMR